MTIERRARHTEFRDIKGDPRKKWATAVTYGTVDDFGTIWQPGVFDKSLDTRMPIILFGHDWENLGHVLGKGIDKRQSPDGPPGVDVLLEFDDPDFVPMARQAMYQVANKTITDVSVGFERRSWLRSHELTQDQRSAGAKEAMVEAGMDELSLVPRGAVVGAGFRARRSAGVVDLDAVVAIAKRKAAGELTDAEAQAAIDLLTGTPSSGEAKPAERTPEEIAAEQAEAAELDGELDALLDGRSARR